MKIYNVRGQEIKTLVNEFQIAGRKTVVWDGLNELGQKVSSGIYIYHIDIGNVSKSKKMIIIQ